MKSGLKGAVRGVEYKDIIQIIVMILGIRF